MTRLTLHDAFTAGFFAGFMATGEGYNYEYPFSDHGRDIYADEHVLAELDHQYKQFLKGHDNV